MPDRLPHRRRDLCSRSGADRRFPNSRRGRWHRAHRGVHVPPAPRRSAAGGIGPIPGRPGRFPRALEAAQTLADVASAYLINAQARADLQDSSDQSRDAALHDSLTGLPNRALMLQRLEHAFRRGSRSGKTSAVFFLDLDRFKVVNDTYGHQVGDELLVAVAERLTAVLRPGDSLARLASDEFVVLCEDLDDPTRPTAIAARFDAALASPFSLADVELSLTPASGSPLPVAAAMLPRLSCTTRILRCTGQNADEEVSSRRSISRALRRRGPEPPRARPARRRGSWRATPRISADRRRRRRTPDRCRGSPTLDAPGTRSDSPSGACPARRALRGDHRHRKMGARTGLVRPPAAGSAMTPTIFRSRSTCPRTSSCRPASPTPWPPCSTAHQPARTVDPGGDRERLRPRRRTGPVRAQ